MITPFYPIFQNATGQLDGSFYYSINENIKVGVQAQNILNEVSETEQFIPAGAIRGPRSFNQQDRRVTGSIRFNF